MNSRSRILLVDDDIDLSNVVRLRLEAQGYDVATANSGREGVYQVRNFNPHLVLLDVDMPEKNGLATFLELKALLPSKNDERGKALFPVVIYSGFRGEKIHDLFTSEGVFDFLVKPVSSQTLLQMVERALEHFSSVKEGVSGKDQNFTD